MLTAQVIRLDLHTKEEWLGIGDVLKSYENIYILSDDIYEKIVYDTNDFKTIAVVCPFLKRKNVNNEWIISLIA